MNSLIDRRRWAGWTLIGVIGALAAGCASQRVLSHGRFDNIQMLAPQSNIESVVLLLSGGHGVGPRDRGLARALTRQGALVAMLNTPALLASLATDKGCSHPDGDLENLGHYIEAAYALPGYRPPILAGTGVGAALALAALAQANDHTFAGAVTTAFAPGITTRARLCLTGALSTHAKPWGFSIAPAPGLAVPWFVQQSDKPASRAIRHFVAATGSATLLGPGMPGSSAIGDRSLAEAFQALRRRQAAEGTAALPASVADLPLIILSRSGHPNAYPRTMAILMSGDGGWAGLDKAIGRAVAAEGIPVVGFDSLRYYWTSRTPEEASHDLARIMRYYRKRWRRPRVLLIGYSRGADVMPFLINRLPPENKKTIARAVMLGLGSHITFQFEIRSWFGFSNDGVPVAPEAAALPAGLGVCIYGSDDDDSICQRLNPKRTTPIRLPGGHHFDGDYAHLARLVLDSLPAGREPPARDAISRGRESLSR